MVGAVDISKIQIVQMQLLQCQRTINHRFFQAAGHLPINVREQNIDMLSLSAHKFHGPKGVGLLYARKGIFLTNLIEGGAQERGKRGGTENVPGIAAMAAA